MVKQIPIRFYNETAQCWEMSDTLFALLDDEDYERYKTTWWNIRPENGHVYAPHLQPKPDNLTVALKVELGNTHIGRPFPNRSPYLYRRVLGLGPSSRVRVLHLDGNRLNCQKSNLRLTGKKAQEHSIHNPSLYAGLESMSLSLMQFNPSSHLWEASSKQALIDAEDYDKVKDRQWQVDKTGRLASIKGWRESGASKLSRRLLGLSETDSHRKVIHINGNPLDCRKCNLRLTGNGKKSRVPKPTIQPLTELLDTFTGTAAASQAIIPKLSPSRSNPHGKRKRGRPTNPDLIKAKKRLKATMERIVKAGLQTRYLIELGFSSQTARRIVLNDWPHLSLATLEKALQLVQARRLKYKQLLREFQQRQRTEQGKNPQWIAQRMQREKLAELKRYEF